MASVIRAAERKKTDREKQHEVAKKAAVDAAEAVRNAEQLLLEAKEKVAATEVRVQQATVELQALYQQAATASVPENAPKDLQVPVVPAAPACVDALCSAMGDDPEAQKALDVLRARIAAVWAPPLAHDIFTRTEQKIGSITSLSTAPPNADSSTRSNDEKMFAANIAQRNHPYR